MPLGDTYTITCGRCREKAIFPRGSGRPKSYCETCTPIVRNAHNAGKRGKRVIETKPLSAKPLAPFTLPPIAAITPFPLPLPEPPVEVPTVAAPAPVTESKEYDTSVTIVTGSPVTYIKQGKQPDRKITLNAPRSRVRIVQICDHLFKYAEAVIELKEDGEVFKTIVVSVNAQGWTMKVEQG